MASQWYLLHGGKQHGPLTSANLKKLADEGKITPATSVRLGTEGDWVNASRVQGLFPPAAAVSSGPAQAATKPAAAAPQKTAPPVAPPPPPPRADPLARPPRADPLARTLPKATPLGKSVAVDAGSMPAKILGAVALILGILALATCWLPFVGGLMAWTAIAVGALGLLLGASALVVSALGKGSGLALSIAGTSTSVVGLVLGVVFGVMSGLFQGAPPQPPPVIAKVAPRIVPQPKREPPAVKEPEPEPEPQWTDAGEPIEQGDIRARIASAGIEKVRLESLDLSTLKAAKPQSMLVVRVSIENVVRDKIVEVPGWSGGGDLVSQDIKNLLGNSEVGKAVQSTTATALLKDNFGNGYKQTPLMSIMGAGLKAGGAASVRPGQNAKLELVFDVPLDTVEFLRLELSPAGFSGTEPLRFQIPKATITGF